MFGSFSKLCGGNVRPARIISLQTDGTVIECDGTVATPPWGISQPSVRRMALAGWDDGFAGIVGSPPINVFGPGDDEAKLVLGGTVNPGQYIKAAAGGVGVAATTAGDMVIAQAHREGGNSGDVIEVKPMRFDIGALGE